MSDANVTMPFSEDAERGLLCSLMLGGDKVAVELAVPAEAFYIPSHRMIWETLTDLISEKRTLDFYVVKNRLIKLDQLEEIGGVETLSALYGFVPTHANYRHYANMVVDDWRLRNAIVGARGILDRLVNRGKLTWTELRPDVEAGLVSIIRDGGDDNDPELKELVLAWLDELAVRKERLQREGIGFGLPKLDGVLGWQQPGELVVIGAPTSRGKTLLAYQGIVHNCGNRKLPTGLISLEMTAPQTFDRMASHHEQIHMQRFRDGEFYEDDLEKLHRFAEWVIKQMPMWTCYRRLDIDGIKSWTRRMHARHGLKLLVVDYLQRVGVPRKMQKVPRQEQVAYISSELKSLALELGLVIWCPCQLNKEKEVRESAAIEFDADISIHLDIDNKDNGSILFQKVRQGFRGEPVPIELIGRFQTVHEKAATQ